MRSFFLLLCAACAFGCTGSPAGDDDGTPDASDAGAAVPDSSAPDAPQGSDASGPAMLRLGNFATPPLLDSGKTSVPAIDVCLDGHATPHFTTEVTPPVTGGVTQRALSAYYELSPGQHQASIVSLAGGATDCAAPLASAAFTVAAGDAITVLLIGDTDGGPVPLAAPVFHDEPSSSVADGQTLVRLIATSPVFQDVGVESSEGDAGPETPLFSSVGYGAIGSGAGIDPDGYRAIDMGLQSWHATWTGANGTASSVVGDLTTPDTVWTVFFYGRSTMSADSMNQTQLYFCKDSSTAKPLAPCGWVLLPPPH